MSRYADDATISGSIVVTGSATFNDQSKDVDFTVESDGNTHMLHVDAGNDRVGIGTGTPDYTLDVAGDIGVDQYIYHNGDANTYINFTDDKIVLKVGGSSYVTLHKQDDSPHFATINDGSNNIDFIVKGNGSNAGNPGMKFDASTNKLGINGVGTPSYELDVAGDIGLSEYIYHKGDDDTFIRFETDQITVKAGDVSFINITEDDSQDKISLNEGRADVDFIVRSPDEALALYLNSDNEVFHINHGESAFKTKIHSTNGEAITVNNSGVILNEDGHATNDFRVESDNNTDMLFVDAGNDKVGIGTDAPGVTLEVEAAAGDIFKMENTTAYGITYGQLVKENLTLTDSGSPIDTTLDLPAASVIEDVLITVKTVAVGTTFNITNVALTANSQTSNIKGSSFSSIDMTNNAGYVGVGTQYALGNTDQSFPAGRATLLLSSTADIKLVYDTSSITTEPVVDVVVFYKKYETS